MRISIAFIIFVLGVLIYWINLSNCKVNVLKKLYSKDNKVLVTLTEESCGGATVGFSYKLYFSDVEDNNPYKSEVLKATEVSDNLNINWINERILNLEISSSRIYSFTNFWYSKNGNEYLVVMNQ